MFHDRIFAWNKMIAKSRWHYTSVCSLVGHDWKLADDNTIDYQWTSGCIFLQLLIDIMFASDTGLESESQNDDDTEQSTEVDNMVDVVYEDETDRNCLVRDIITITFGAEYVLKQNIVRKMIFCLFYL